MNTSNDTQMVSFKIAQKNPSQKFELKPWNPVALPLQSVVQPDRLTAGSYRADQPLLDVKSGWYSSQSVVRRKEDTKTPLENAETPLENAETPLENTVPKFNISEVAFQLRPRKIPARSASK